jgi:oligopeptide transport system permease protein
MGLVFRLILNFLFSIWALATVLFLALKFYVGRASFVQLDLHPLVAEQMIKLWGLDLPLHVQYLKFMSSMTSLNFGKSFVTQESVKELVFRAANYTLWLNFIALVCILVISLVSASLEVGFFEDRKKNPVYHLTTLFAALPSVLLAPFLIWLFAIKLDILPLAFLFSPSHYILPVLALALKPSAQIARVLATEMWQAKKMDHVRMARAKGLSQSQILIKHILRNSLGAIFGYTVPILVSILSGSIFIEILFSLQGLGKEFINSALQRDMPTLFALTFMNGCFVLFFSGLMEFFSTRLDPRREVDL